MKIIKIICLIILILQIKLSYAQEAPLKRGKPEYFDSINTRITELQNMLPRLKQSCDVSIFATKRELDNTIFLKTYEEYVFDEELFKAKDLVEKKLDRAGFRRDNFSIGFYTEYKKKINSEIKNQKIKYQKLFSKERYYKKAFNSNIKKGTIEAYNKAKRMTELALKYATEKNLTESAEFLKNYLDYAEAKIFDYYSKYDLVKLTNSEKNYEKVFLPMISSDSLKTIKEAATLVDHCYHYANSTNCFLTPDYFNIQKNAVSAAITDFYEKYGNTDFGDIKDQSIIARLDTLNKKGVYKWHNYIVVINEIDPEFSWYSIKKGEVIIHADKTLSKYIKANKLARIKKGLKLGKTYVIPYKSSTDNSEFYYNTDEKKWQYIVCYTKIMNNSFIKEISKYMPSLLFAEEEIN